MEAELDLPGRLEGDRPHSSRGVILGLRGRKWWGMTLTLKMGSVVVCLTPLPMKAMGGRSKFWRLRQRGGSICVHTLIYFAY